VGNARGSRFESRRRVSDARNIFVRRYATESRSKHPVGFTHG